MCALSFVVSHTSYVFCERTDIKYASNRNKSKNKGSSVTKTKTTSNITFAGAWFLVICLFLLILGYNVQKMMKHSVDIFLNHNKHFHITPTSRT